MMDDFSFAMMNIQHYLKYNLVNRRSLLYKYQLRNRQQKTSCGDDVYEIRRDLIYFFFQFI